MANTSQTIFQRLGTIFSGRNSVSPIMTKLPPTFDSVASNQVLYSTKDRNDYERKLNQYKQQKLLSYQWVKAGVDNSIESLAGLNAVKLMYRDADLMDGMPEIGAALDILSEEACLVGETKIKLLNGKTETIENLYKNKCANFWVYSVDESGICRPSCVEKVIYKGEKEVIKITLDDGTIVRCTPDHKLMLSDCSWKEAKDLAFGDSLMSIYDDINYLGYEQIKSTVENKKRLTHRVVAENVLRDDRYKDYRDLKKNLYNHRVTSVEIENSKEKVYDLLNSSTNNCFGIKCNNGQIISHNCAMKSNGKMLNVYSKSKRVKAILEDLFVNRLHIHTDLPMIARATLKYGNQFMLLNIDEENGILGWKQLPVYEIDRVENGYTTSPSAGAIPINAADIRPDKTRFIWVGHNESTPYEDWQMAHFRLLKDSFFLPYGVSHLHKARRAWRMWSMMEDAMLIYRLDKSIERRVFKIYVGSIDDQDVPAFIQQVADNFKRTPVIDPLTGQIDLRKNFLDVSSDYFIPVRDPSAPTPIENLASAQNPTSMDDINYMQNKVFSALRVPKQFLNFQEAQGKGQNLSLLDVRFARMVNTLQQFLLLELNKIAMIHLHLLGLDDDIMNFTLSLNNPSAQIEALELEDLTKRINTATQALADPGIGMPLMSLHMVLKKIMKLTDSEIKDMLNEIRLEKAMAAELANTAAIIKKTGMFDAVDNIYGDYDAMNDPNASAQQPGMGDENGMGMGMSGGGAIGGGGGGFDGGALTFDSLEGGGDMGGSMGDINGTEATTDMSNAPNLDAGKPNESKDKNKPLLNEARSKFFNSAKSFTQRYFDLLSELEKRDNGNEEELANIEGKVTTINEQIGNLFNKIDAILEENSNPDFSKTVEDNDDEMISSPSTSITESDLDNELLSNE